MKKNGFTLVELVVTIALIGIISAISFVSINGLIKKDKINKCNSLLNNIKNASHEYVSDNRYNSNFVSKVENNQVSINTDTLIRDNYLNSGISIYKDNNKYNNLNVIITLDKNLKYKSVSVKVGDTLIECDDGWEIK